MSEPAQTNQPGMEGAVDKGKGKAVEQPHDLSMDEDDSSSDEEPEPEPEEFAKPSQQGPLLKLVAHISEAEEEDDDNMEEISTENIIGSRTRGKRVDYQKAAAEADDLPEDDEEDDDDFHEEGEDHEMQG